MSDLFGARIATQPPDALPAGVARPRGAYYTPDALALACARALHGTWSNLQPRIVEPGCGGGAFLRASRRAWRHAEKIHGVDLVPAAESCADFTAEPRDLFTLPDGEYDLAIGNPDFGIAEEVVRKSLRLVSPSGGVVAMLLRISFLGSLGRVPLYREHPLVAFWPIAGRPSFTGGGADTSEYGFFVWMNGPHTNGVIHPPLEWKP